MEKLIITVALTGNVPTKEMNPYLPVTALEIADDVKRCADAGASVFHVHARDENQKPTLNLQYYRENVARIKERSPDVIIQLSTGARAGREWEDRAGPVRLLPEMASFTTGSTNLPGIVYENSPPFLEFLGTVFKETGVKPELEIFEAGMINNAIFLGRKGYFDPPYHFNFVLGAPGAMGANVKNLLFLSESIPPASTWSATGLGKAQISIATMAIVMGGHVRVGLEDNLFMPDGSLATNAKQVEKVVKIAREIGRDVANPEEARKILSLDPTKKERIMNRIGGIPSIV